MANGLLVEQQHVRGTTNHSEEQAIDRIHRLGQTRPVTVHRLLVDHTIEDRILAIQARKRELVQHALGSKRSAANDTLDQLRWLFEEDT